MLSNYHEHESHANDEWRNALDEYEFSSNGG